MSDFLSIELESGAFKFINLDRILTIEFFPAGSVFMSMSGKVERKEDELVFTGRSGFKDSSLYGKDARRAKDDLKIVFEKRKQTSAP